MTRLHRYTLIAAQRGTFRRGASVTVPAGSSRDLELSKDPAWRCTVMAASAPGPATTQRSTALYQQLVSFMQQHATRVASLSAEDRAGYTAMLEASGDHLRPLFMLSFGATQGEVDAMRAEAERERAWREPVESDDVSDEPAGGEPRGGPAVDEVGGDAPLPPSPPPPAPSAEHLALRAALDAVTLDSKAHTIAELVELAGAAGLVLPDPLPRTKADLVGHLTDLLVG